MPSVEISCPRNVICLWRKLHLKVSTTVHAPGSAQTWLVTGKDGPLPYLNTLSCRPGTPGHRSDFNSPRQFCMSLWNVAGALHNPYGIRRNSYMPRLATVKAVYCQDFSDICTCQNPDFRSILEKNRAPTMDSMVSCMRGRGNESFLVLEFNFRKLIQNWRVPSFFRTRTMALHQGDLDGWIAPTSSMSCRFSQTSQTTP